MLYVRDFVALGFTVEVLLLLDTEERVLVTFSLLLLVAGATFLVRVVLVGVVALVERVVLVLVGVVALVERVVLVLVGVVALVERGVVAFSEVLVVPLVVPVDLVVLLAKRVVRVLVIAALRVSTVLLIVLSLLFLGV